MKLSRRCFFILRDWRRCGYCVVSTAMETDGRCFHLVPELAVGAGAAGRRC